MKKLVLIFLLPFVGNLSGQVEDVRITADGTVINTKTVKFATGKLMVNGVAVVGGPAGVNSVTGTAPIVSSGGLTPAISIVPSTGSVPGSMSAADKTKLDGIAAGAQPGTVTSVTVTGANGVGVTGSPITTSGTIALSLGAITPTSLAASGAVSGSNLSGTNTGDQTSIVGITGTTAQFNTALTDANFATGGGTATGTNTGDQSLSGLINNSSGVDVIPITSDLAGNLIGSSISENLGFTSIGNLTSNGFVTTSGGTGALSVDTTTYTTTARTISTTSPLTGGGDLSANRTFAINDAGADGTTKGASTYTAADFNATAGLVSLDYTNGQAATTSLKGFLTSTDWNTFNGKANITSPTFTGTVTIPTPFTLGAVSVLPTGTELNFVDGVTSSIQTQLDAKGPAPSDTAYDESTWNGVTTIAPSKNAVRDVMETKQTAAQVQALITANSHPLSVYAVGAVYLLTNVPAALDFGTTDPVLTIDQAGTYLILARVTFNIPAGLNGASAVTLKLRRTNNTAADISNSLTSLLVYDTATVTDQVFSVSLPQVLYTTAGTTDILTIFGDSSANYGNVSEACFVAIRLY